MPSSCPQARIAAMAFSCLVLVALLFVLGYAVGAQRAADDQLQGLQDELAVEYTTDPPADEWTATAATAATAATVW